MRNIITAAVAALCCFSLMAGSCTKSKQQANLFSSRHWHRTRITTTTCYTVDTPPQQISKSTSTSEFDTVFAITEKNGGINFLSYQMGLLSKGDTDQYMYTNGLASSSVGFILFYAKSKNVIYTRIDFEGRKYTDQFNTTTCYDDYDIRWTSSN